MTILATLVTLIITNGINVTLCYVGAGRFTKVYCSDFLPGIFLQSMLEYSDNVLEFCNLISLLMNGFQSESMNGRINISVCGVDKSTLYACLVRHVNLEIYLCIGVSCCLGVFNLCFAMISLPNSENLSKSLCLITSHSWLLFWSSLIWLHSEPLAVNIATAMLVLPVTSDSLSISSNHNSKSLGFVPSHVLALIKELLLWSVCLMKDRLIKYINYCVVYVWRLWGIVLPYTAVWLVSGLWLWWWRCCVWVRLRVKGWELVLQGQHFMAFCLNLGLKIWDLLLMCVNNLLIIFGTYF